MKRPRKYVGIREKWAAALSMLLPQALRDELREKRVPAKTIISMFDQDGYVVPLPEVDLDVLKGSIQHLIDSHGSIQ